MTPGRHRPHHGSSTPAPGPEPVAASDVALLAALERLGAGAFPHLDGSLIEHLQGTQALLRGWGASAPVCTAGLYHAVYGTDGYSPALVSPAGRASVAAVMGPEAEALAYLYGACDRSVCHPRIGTPSEALFADRFSGTEYPLVRDQLASLCDITIANELEIAGRSAAFRAAHGVALMSLFKRMAGRASEPALQAAQSLLGHSPP